MNRLGLRVVALLTFVFLGTLPVYGVTLDAVLDFSNVNNPSGAWTYGYVPAGSTDTDGFAEFDTNNTDYPASGVSSWSSGPASVPLIGRNTTGSDVTVLSTITLPPNLLLLYANDTSDWAVLRWTAPAAGDYVLTAYMQNIGDSPATVDVALDGVLQGLLLNGLPFPLDTYGETLYVSLGNVWTFAEGQTLDFVVENGGVGVAATADIPEPASLLLAVLGLAGLGMLRRRTNL